MAQLEPKQVRIVQLTSFICMIVIGVGVGMICVILGCKPIVLTLSVIIASVLSWVFSYVALSWISKAPL